MGLVRVAPGRPAARCGSTARRATWQAESEGEIA